jgi:putative protein-disulfide isomerase
MCSWCWAFRPVWAAVVKQLPDSITVHNLLGGLAADSDEAMPLEMQKQIRGFWQVIERRVLGTQFNYDFWENCSPRRSTWPACRAIIAARNQGAEFEEPMILAIQRAYYLQAQNPSDHSVLAVLAESLGMNSALFKAALNRAETHQQLASEMQFSQRMGARGFPSLILLEKGLSRVINIDYNDPQSILEQLI